MPKIDIIKGTNCKNTICGNYCLNLCNRDHDNHDNKEDNYHTKICIEYQYKDKGTLLQFKKCGCNTHWLCLMDLITTYSKTFLECPSCGTMIYDNKDCDDKEKTDYVKFLSLRAIISCMAIDIIHNGDWDKNDIFKLSDISFT